MAEKTSYPQWVLNQKRPGTEVRRIRGFYYLYEAKCVYDKEKKRGRKVTGRYMSELLPEANLSGDCLTKHIRKIGVKREAIVNFCREFRTADDNIIFDGTDLLSESSKMSLPKFGITNSGKGPKDVYVDYKSRCSVETMIDTFKNVPDIGHGYMQNEHALG